MAGIDFVASSSQGLPPVADVTGCTEDIAIAPLERDIDACGLPVCGLPVDACGVAWGGPDAKEPAPVATSMEMRLWHCLQRILTDVFPATLSSERT
jgi:hypothetical protein